jgi:pentose-5-phosphate-3-epimerase
VERDPRLDDAEEEGAEHGRDECELDGGLSLLGAKSAACVHAAAVVGGAAVKNQRRAVGEAARRRAWKERF